MIDFISDLVLLLSQDFLDVEDVVARIGSVAHDPGIPMPLELLPAVRGILAGSISRYPDSGLPFLVTIEFQEDVQPSVAALKLAFGDFRRILTDRGMPAEIMFLPPPSAHLWSVAIIANVEQYAAGLESSFVTSVTLRRDPRPPPLCEE